MASSCPTLRSSTVTSFLLLRISWKKGKNERKVIYNVNGLVSIVLVPVESYYTIFPKVGLVVTCAQTYILVFAFVFEAAQTVAVFFRCCSRHFGCFLWSVSNQVNDLRAK